MTEPFESPSFASGRIWGVARPRVRYTRADVERLVDETAAHLFRIGRIPGPPAVLEDGKSASFNDLGRRILAAKKRGGR